MNKAAFVAMFLLNYHQNRIVHSIFQWIKVFTIMFEIKNNDYLNQETNFTIPQVPLVVP